MRLVSSFLSTWKGSVRKAAQGPGKGGAESPGGAHLNVGDGRVEGAGPVDEAGTAVDDAFLVEPDKGLCHSHRQFLGGQADFTGHRVQSPTAQHPDLSEACKGEICS